MTWWEFTKAFWLILWHDLWPIIIIGGIGVFLVIVDIVRWIFKRPFVYDIRRR